MKSKITTAKAFLQQLQKLDKLIENKQVEKMQWQALAQQTTPVICGDKIQASRTTSSKMEDAIIKCCEIDDEISERIEEFILVKKDVISVIEQLNAAEYDLIHKMYVQHYSLFEIATMNNKTYSWATTVHGRALKDIQKILDKRNV